MRVIVTGASGFVGRHLMGVLDRVGVPAVGIVRGDAPLADSGGGSTYVRCALRRTDDLVGILREGDTVVHLAGRTHVMHERAVDPSAAFHAANVVTTAVVCDSAVRAGA